MLSTAVRADRMRGGRNKFGPLYRRDRQMKQQRAHLQTSSAPYRIKQETTHAQRPTTRDDLPVANHTSTPSSSDAFHQTYMYSPGTVQSGVSVPLDCTVNTDRILTPPSLPCPARHYSTLPVFSQEKGDRAFTRSTAPADPVVHPNSAFTPRGTPVSATCSALRSGPSLSRALTQTSHTPPPAYPTTDFLNLLMECEQDESQMCAKVLASLQREQANRGKHDCLNTFSIICKMADQTLFGLVEWARNTTLFKELKVIQLWHVAGMMCVCVCVWKLCFR